MKLRLYARDLCLRLLIGSTALAAVLAIGAFGPVSSAKAEDITIAVAGPMTGELAAFGEQLKRGAEKAVADINAKGGVNGESAEA